MTLRIGLGTRVGLGVTGASAEWQLTSLGNTKLWLRGDAGLTTNDATVVGGSDLTNGAWTADGVASRTATTFTEDTSGVYHRIYQTPTGAVVDNAVVTFDAKHVSGAREGLLVNFGATSYAVVGLTGAVEGSVLASVQCSVAVRKLANDWYRVRVAFNTVQTHAIVQFLMWDSVAGTVYTGDGSSTMGVTNISIAQGFAMTWADQSGSGNDVSTGGWTTRAPLVEPVYANGYPALRFDGTDDAMLKTGGTALTTSTIFAVVRFGQLNQAPGDYDYIAHVGRGDGGASSCCSMSRWEAAGGNDNKFYSYDGFGARLGPVVAGQQWMILEQIADGAAPYHKLWINGVAQTVTDYTAPITTNGSFCIGAYNPNDSFGSMGNYLNGHLAEYVVFSDVKTAGDRSLVRAKLSSKYKIAVTL